MLVRKGVEGFNMKKLVRKRKKKKKNSLLIELKMFVHLRLVCLNKFEEKFEVKLVSTNEKTTSG